MTHRQALTRRLAEAAIAVSRGVGDAAAARALIDAAIAAGEGGAALPLLTRLRDADPGDGDLAYRHGIALAQAQDLVAAERAFAAARAAAPDDAARIAALGQTRFELGQPAAALFADAHARAPDRRDWLRSRAGALAAEGDDRGAAALLAEALTQAPDWLDGHRALATLRWTHAHDTPFDEGYARAVATRPRDGALWVAWFRAVAQTRDWAAARRILDRADRAVGPQPALTIARLFLAVEGDGASVAEVDALLDATAATADETVHLCHIRHSIRQRRYDVAERVAIGLLLSPAARMVWPYLSLVWRVTEDPRWEWLERPEVAIRTVAVDLDARELATLADVLRALHTLPRAYAEQSVRGGTQTDRSIMLRHEPILQRTRAQWIAAIRDYVDALPALEQGHPLLGVPRDRLRIAGSWSVRLLAQGRNVPHNHPMGWLSTAFYIALPQPLGAPPAGHIAFGMAPEGLGLDLPPYRTIEPKVGETAVFPSTAWHATIPFADGERLALALDIAPPR